jgi:hypothetical protein
MTPLPSVSLPISNVLCLCKDHKSQKWCATYRLLACPNTVAHTPHRVFEHVVHNSYIYFIKKDLTLTLRVTTCLSLIWGIETCRDVPAGWAFWSPNAHWSNGPSRLRVPCKLLASCLRIYRLRKGCGFVACHFNSNSRLILVLNNIVNRIVQYPGLTLRDSIPDGTRATARRLIHECQWCYTDVT